MAILLTPTICFPQLKIGKPDNGVPEKPVSGQGMKGYALIHRKHLFNGLSGEKEKASSITRTFITNKGPVF